MKAQSYCCVCNALRPFTPTLQFSAHPFPHYSGTVIGRCRVCGCFKTIHQPKNFNPAQSRFEMYESDHENFEKEFDPIIRGVAERIQKKGRVLEVGCSSGMLLRILKQKGYDVWGVEANEQAANFAQTSLQRQVIAGTLRQSVEKLPKQFDCIIYNHVLEHIENPLEELTQALRLLRKGGVVIIGIPNRDNWVAYFRKTRWESLMPGEHIWHFRTIDMISILKQLQTKIRSVTFSNHHRSDYPAMKKLSFTLLTFLNTLTRTGEAVLIVATKG